MVKKVKRVLEAFTLSAVILFTNSVSNNAKAATWHNGTPRCFRGNWHEKRVHFPFGQNDPKEYWHYGTYSFTKSTFRYDMNTAYHSGRVSWTTKKHRITGDGGYHAQYKKQNGLYYFRAKAIGQKGWIYSYFKYQGYRLQPWSTPTESTTAYVYRYGIHSTFPSYALGYWHTQKKHGVTLWLHGKYFEMRNSGWQNHGGKKTRYNWYYGPIKRKRFSNRDVIWVAGRKGVNSISFALHWSNKKHALYSGHSNGSKWERLYPGVG